MHLRTSEERSCRSLEKYEPMEVLVVIHRDIRINTIVCKHYGFPYPRNRSSNKEAKTKPNCVTNKDKKRKEKSLEPVLESDQHQILSCCI